MGYNKPMSNTIETKLYSHWIDRLKNRHVRLRINVRIRRLELGNLGDTKVLGEGLHEFADRLWTRISRLLVAGRN
jgi:putative addiction module killer protein